jgi:hypothetical protein
MVHCNGVLLKRVNEYFGILLKVASCGSELDHSLRPGD